MRYVHKLLTCAVVALVVAACADRPMEPDGFTAVADNSAFARVGPPGPCCYLDGRVVRTLVPPSSQPNEGRDPLFAFTSGGVEGQLAVIRSGPGDGDYHGGSWAFNAVTWNVTPYLITSDEQIDTAAAAGDVTITRVPANDFRCPIQP